ncbi:MAG: hypothetical protein R6U85_00755, partial [Salinivirgaceae bacterium]
LKERIFEKTFEVAEIAKFTPEQVRSYEDSLKYYRDLKNSLDTASDERAIEIAKNMIKKEYDTSEIMELTGLSAQQIEKLR